MKTYARLQHSRMHSDPQGLSTFFNGAQSSAEGSKDNGGGGSYRLGAAVQRAMAMRERKCSPSSKSDDIKGIGGMRDAYMSWITHSPPPHHHSNSSAGYFSQVSDEEIICSAMGAQSMKYRRFSCPDVNGLHEEFGHVNSNGKPKVRIGGHCSFGEDVSKNGGVKKSLVTRLCRQLFSRRKKSSGMNDCR